ncbi:MAG: GPP34 family phosphoprotein [Gemmatimonadetes bacterium]|nr:GPP34 family phosphoprotein [Gemmatimonadota bacterium]
MASLAELHLHEQLLLLALHDDKGTIQGANFALGAAGAILVELLLGGHIAIDAVKKKKFVTPGEAALPGDPILDEVLQRIRTAKRNEQVNTWISRIAATKRLPQRTAERLRFRGILGRREGRVLLFFTRELFPTNDPAPERELVQRIREAVLGDAEVPVRVAVLTALANQLSLLGPVLDKQERKARKQRLKQVSELDAVDAATRAAVKGVQEVIAAQAAVAAAIVATG